MRPFSILHLFDCMIIAPVDNRFLSYLRMSHIVHQCPADSPSASGIDESVLRTGVKCIFPIDEFGMKHDIALLASGLQIIGQRRTTRLWNMLSAFFMTSNCTVLTKEKMGIMKRFPENGEK